MLALKLSVSLVVPGQPCTMWISLRESVVSADAHLCFADTGPVSLHDAYISVRSRAPLG